jgi:uncharacterized protein
MEKNHQNLIRKTEGYIQKFFRNEGSGHDWWHIYRVRNYSLKIAQKEGGNLFLIEMAALLHDLDDWKLKSEFSKNRTEKWLQKSGAASEEVSKIIEIISQVSFKGAGVDTNPTTIEAQIVQDADRLDAIGAIGIARAFAYGGNKDRLIYHPDIQPELHNNFQSYKNNTAPTINHFYEKLLLLKDRMNTTEGKRLAEIRHEFMLDFLDHFFSEWNSNI